MAELPRMLSAETSHSASIFSLVKSTLGHHHLIMQMVKRDVVGRYKGSTIGLAWSFFNPILMLLIYTIVFSEIFNMRWGGAAGDESKMQFAILLFTGMIVLSFFTEVLNKSPQLIISNVNYVKKVIFPLETLTVVSIGVALFHAAMSFLILIIAYLLIHGSLNWTLVYVPVVALPIIILSLGFSWALAALGVYLRDVSQIVTVTTSILMFLSPVFYPMDAVPEDLRAIILLNPLTFIIEQMREVIIWGNTPDLLGLLTYTVISVIVMWLGFALFQKTRTGFADVL